jgi:hypothetical protein
MKRLMTILVLFAMCGVAMAQQLGPNLSTGKYKYDKGVYTEIKGKELKNNPYSSPLTMNYTSAGWGTSHIGKAYFTTMSENNLSKYKDDNGNSMTKVVVQFLGNDIDDSRPNLKDAREDITGKITDYGIYLYNEGDTLANIKQNLMSVSNGISFSLDPGTNFGIYYIDSTGREWYSTENYVGTYDPDEHYINYYDENGEKYLKDGVGVTAPDGKVYSDKVDIRYTCAFMTTHFGDHWEFMLETTLDNPYYNVDPNDKDQFGGNGDVNVPSGQPLPGTLATLLIGGLCAGALRKKNKKH